MLYFFIFLLDIQKKVVTLHAELEMPKTIIMNKVTKFAFFSLVVLLSSCANQAGNNALNTQVSNTTGWYYKYNNKALGVAPDQLGVPMSMVPIEGGKFTIGEKSEFITAPRNNAQRDITVSPFYMDKFEVTNLNWREYETWMKVVFGSTAPNLVNEMLPDTTVWRDDLAYNEPYVDNYYRHPGFNHYPVVGVSWNQAMAYCQWRTDRANELALVTLELIAAPNFDELVPTSDEAVKEAWESKHHGYTMTSFEVASPTNPDSIITYYRPSYEYVRDQFVFNTDKYTRTNYTPAPGKKAKNNATGAAMKVSTGNGVLLAGYRLPTEAEWEFAAYAPIAGEDGLTTEGRIYPWSGYQPRNLTAEQQGQMQANFVRGKGDMMGMSGALNDKYVITGPVYSFSPNDFGLYNMAGNVNEWVLDVYRETSAQEFTEYNSFRGNLNKRPVKSASGAFVIDSLGQVAMEFYDDKRDAKDGDYTSLILTNYPLVQDTAVLHTVDSALIFKYDPTDILAPKITKETRVYKGGSWRDRIYWLNPSTRRYLDQDKSSNTIGFRCAMSSVGAEDVF